MTIIEEAKAKVNLYLNITGKRQDGYHLLDSIFMFTENIFDEVYFTKDKNLSLNITGNFSTSLDGEGNNLVIKAAKLLKETYKIFEGANITLVKNLPVSSGIGGGSADCAAALRGLNKLWNLNLNNEDLAKLGLKLGADVPACIYSTASNIKGIGEIITPVSLNTKDLWAVLINPLESVSTKEIFKHYTLRQADFCDFDYNKDFISEISKRKNDLEPIATQLCPKIKDILSAFSKTKNCLFFQMSGSGATCFGLYKSKNEAKVAAELIKSVNKKWWINFSKLI